MAEHWALIKGGAIENIIVADQDFATTYAADNDYETLQVDTLDPHPGIGWTYDGTTFTAPIPDATLAADPVEIPPDGTTTSTVTYTNNTDIPPTEVTFDVNGATSVAPVTGGVATVEVASSTPGDTVTVMCEGLSAVVTVSA